MNQMWLFCAKAIYESGWRSNHTDFVECFHANRSIYHRDVWLNKRQAQSTYWYNMIQNLQHNCHMSQFHKYQHSNWLLPMVSDTIFSLEWISLRWPLANDYVFPISTKMNGMSKARAFKSDSLNSVSISMASVTFLVQGDFWSSSDS